MIEPLIKRLCVFFDGQNLYHSAKEAFGYTYPNFDPVALAQDVAHQNGWEDPTVRFYTGMPSPSFDPRWSQFWSSKLQVLGSRGVVTFTRALRYQKYETMNSDGSKATKYIGQEKGIDVRIAIDIVKGALRNEFDVALIFSQDQDLSEVADEVKSIAQVQNRWIKVVSAYPFCVKNGNHRGINGTDWIKIKKAQYDRCIDSTDYRKSP